VTGENTFGFKWTEVERLMDLDFADDIPLLDIERWDGIKQLTERVQTEAANVGLAINPDKTKVMKIGKWQGTDRIVIEEIEEVEDFCYLGSVMSSNSSCDKEINTRMGKANAVFGRLERI